jgi:hypothetical protein
MKTIFAIFLLALMTIGFGVYSDYALTQSHITTPAHRG